MNIYQVDASYVILKNTVCPVRLFIEAESVYHITREDVIDIIGSHVTADTLIFTNIEKLSDEKAYMLLLNNTEIHSL